MAIIGNGAQSEFQAIAFKALLGIDQLRLYDIDPVGHRRNAPAISPASASTSPSARPAQEAVEGAEIITTVTADKQYATILTDNMVGAGVHINAVGGDCPGKTELHRDILLRSDIFVEYPPQTRIEGEIQQLDRRPSGDRALAGDRRQGAGPPRRQADHAVRFASASPSRIFRRCAMSATSCKRPASTRSSTCSPTPTSRATCSACCCAPRAPRRLCRKLCEAMRPQKPFGFGVALVAQAEPAGCDLRQRNGVEQRAGIGAGGAANTARRGLPRPPAALA